MPFTNNKAEPYGISTAIIKTDKNAKWAIFGYSFWKGIIPYAQRERVLNVADYISDNSLNARVISPVQAVLQIRVNKNRKTEAVSLTNATVGKEKNIVLIVRNPQCEYFELDGQYVKRRKLQYLKQGNEYIIKIPYIPPYSVVTIFCNKFLAQDTSSKGY
jgi:hypothetical protein